MRDFTPRFVELGLMSPDERTDLEDYWSEAAVTPGAFLYTPIMLRVVAERPR